MPGYTRGVELSTPPRSSAPRRAESPLIGKPAPSFTLQNLNGKQVSLSDFKGKVVLLDFWATWCGPCVQAIPHLEALHKEYKDQGLVLIGINHERDHAKVREFAKERISYVVLLDADEQFTQYGIRGIPTLFYIDREGKVRYRDVGFGPGKEKKMEQKVKELLAGSERTASPKPEASTGIVYEGGDGSSMENAVIIKGAPNSRAGIKAEYAWIGKNPPGPGCRLRKQALMSSKGKMYDRFDYTTPDGETKSIYFDITDFFGKR